MQSLRLNEIAKAFVQVVIDVKQVVVLDNIAPLPDLPGFLIESHDIYGPLPDVQIKETGDRWMDLESVGIEAAKLAAINHVRADLAAFFPGCRFLQHRLRDQRANVGVECNRQTFEAEAVSFLEAYHKLKRKAVMIS